jgi:hypothetical protein
MVRTDEASPEAETLEINPIFYEFILNGFSFIIVLIFISLGKVKRFLLII